MANGTIYQQPIFNQIQTNWNEHVILGFLISLNTLLKSDKQPCLINSIVNYLKHINKLQPLDKFPLSPTVFVYQKFFKYLIIPIGMHSFRPHDNVTVFSFYGVMSHSIKCARF